MSLNKNILILFFIFTGVIYSQKEDEINDSISTKSLEEVLITATRTMRQLSSIPLPAQIISKEQLKNSNSVRLTDILNEQTGLITIPDVGGGEGLQIQGVDAAYTLIMIDGVPLVGRLGGTLGLDRITVANIKQIEIVKGASSSLYGSEAMGGVVNIITDTPTNGFKGSFYNRLGTFSTNDTNLDLSYKNEKLAITGSINRFSTKGYNLDDYSLTRTIMPYNNYTFQTKVKYDFSNKTSLTLSSRLFIQDQETNSEYTNEIGNTNILYGDAGVNEWNSTVKLAHKISNSWDIYGEVYATEYQTNSQINNIDGSIFDNDFFNQVFIRPEFRAHYNPNKIHSIIFGAGITHETLDRTYFDGIPEFNAPYVYGQYDLNLFDKLNIILGARYDAHNKYESQFSPKIAARYKISKKLAVKSSVGYGYKAPDFRQLFLNFTNPTRGYTVLGHNLVTSELPKMDERGELTENFDINPIINEYQDDLKAESSVNINFGLDYKFNNKLKLNINIFRNNISNLIDTQVIASKGNGQNVFSYYNANKVYTEGLEFNAFYKPTNHIQVSGGYQLLYAKDKEVEDKYKNGEVFSNQFSSPLKSSHYFGLPNRSRHMANFKIFYKNLKYKFNTNIRGVYRSKYGLIDTNNTQSIDNFDEFVAGYSIWDFAINKDINRNIQLGAGIENLFDFTDFRESNSDAVFINNISGRILYAKININI